MICIFSVVLYRTAPKITLSSKRTGGRLEHGVLFGCKEAFHTKVGLGDTSGGLGFKFGSISSSFWQEKEVSSHAQSNI
ncbi:MAG TPA: hypothetical protein PK971_00725 [Saprospiraceae bacterium]|nr:hypothetical protein [Saprospiraceae bacterium]